MRHPKLKAFVLAAFLITALAAPARVTRAEEPDPGTEAGPKKVLRYTACALGLATAETPIHAVAALLGCIKMCLDELPR